MALNKAQLMEVPGGPGITGAVKPGTGISISGDGTISVNPATNITQLLAGTNITLTPANGFGVVTITAAGGGGGIGTITGVIAGGGLSGGGTSGTVTLTNTGVTGISPGSGITVSGSTGNVTISATGGGSTVYFPTQRSIITTVVTTGGPLAQGDQTLNYSSQSFTIPSGATSVLLSQRISTATFGNGSNPDGTIWCLGCRVSSTFSGIGSGTGLANSANFAAFSANGVSRTQGQFLVRSDLIQLNTSAGGTLSVSTVVGQESSIWANTNFQALQIIVTPIKQ